MLTVSPCCTCKSSRVRLLARSAMSILMDALPATGAAVSGSAPVAAGPGSTDAAELHAPSSSVSTASAATPSAAASRPPIVCIACIAKILHRIDRYPHPSVNLPYRTNHGRTGCRKISENRIYATGGRCGGHTLMPSHRRNGAANRACRLSSLPRAAGGRSASGAG